MTLSAGTAFVDVQPKIGAGFQSGIASKLGPLGVAGGAALAGGIAAGVGGAVALKNIGDTFDDAFDTIRVGTGATGEALEGLKADFKATLTDVPTDAASAATAIADLNTRTGATGETLQDLAATTLELGRITGEDTATLIEKTTRTFGDWGVAVEDSGDALDVLFRASQATGAPVASLADQLVKYGAPLRQFGFGMEESAALLGKFEKEGVNTELAMGSLRIALGKVAKEGGEPAVVLQDTIQAIQDAGSAGEANALAFELFGARAGADMAAAIREGRFELGELFGQVKDGGETVLQAADETSDYRQSWEKLKNQVFVALEPLATKFLDALGRLFDVIGPKVQPVISAITEALSWVGSLFSGLGSGAEEAEGTLGSTFGAIGGLFESVKGYLSTLWEFVQVIFNALRDFWDKWGGTITAIFSSTFDTVVAVLTAAFDILKGLFDVVLGILTGDWSRAWDGIKGIFGAIWDAIVAIFRNVWNNIVSLARGFLENFGSTIRGGLDRVAGFFRELPGKILGFLASLPGKLVQLGADLIAGLVRGLGNIAGAIGDKIKSGISSAISSVKSFFGIGSPSKVMAAELGQPLAQGVALGAEETGRLAGDALVSGIEDAARDAQSAVPALAGAAGALDLRGTRGGAAAGVLGDPGGAGTVIELAAGAVVVHNPVPEPASESVPRELRRLQASLGRS
jgi:TP901 family phage tail tape measure protein